ncbi:MAG: FHA domain-containing protein [Chloroflexi bacterium]|nr:FHA domain-containing protein [Chloroflexota bacterium]
MMEIVVLILRIFLMIFLYLFVGWTIYTLWRDLKFQSQILGSKKIPPLVLYSESDPSFERTSFSKNEVSIGRDDSCDVVLQDDVSSNRHARFAYRNLHWWIEDLASTNGTYLNDERLETPTILITGDELRIGKNILIIDIQEIE